MPDTRGQGYSQAYTRSRREAIEAALEAAREELLFDAKASEAYRKELIKRIADLDDQLAAQQKALNELERQRAKSEAERIKAGKPTGQGEVRDDLIKAQVDIYRIRQNASDNAADRRKDIIFEVEKRFEVPQDLTLATEKLKDDFAAGIAREGTARDIGNVTQNLIAAMQTDEAVRTAGRDASEFQRAQAAERMIADVESLLKERGYDLPPEYKTAIEATANSVFNVPTTLRGTAEATMKQKLEEEKRKQGDEALQRIGGGQLRAPEIGMPEVPEAAAPEAETPEAAIKQELEDIGRDHLIRSLRNDGVITPEEEATYKNALAKATQSAMVETPELDLATLPEVQTLGDLELQAEDDLFIQRIRNIGELTARRTGLVTEREEIGAPELPTQEAIRARAGEILQETIPTKPRIEESRAAQLRASQEFAKRYGELEAGQQYMVRSQMRAQQHLNANDNTLPEAPSGPEGNLHDAAINISMSILDGKADASALHATADQAVRDALGDDASVEAMNAAKQKYYDWAMMNLLAAKRSSDPNLLDLEDIDTPRKAKKFIRTQERKQKQIERQRMKDIKAEAKRQEALRILEASPEAFATEPIIEE